MRKERLFNLAAILGLSLTGCSALVDTLVKPLEDHVRAGFTPTPYPTMECPDNDNTPFWEGPPHLAVGNVDRPHIKDGTSKSIIISGRIFPAVYSCRGEASGVDRPPSEDQGGWALIRTIDNDGVLMIIHTRAELFAESLGKCQGHRTGTWWPINTTDNSETVAQEAGRREACRGLLTGREDPWIGGDDNEVNLVLLYRHGIFIPVEVSAVCWPDSFAD